MKLVKESLSNRYDWVLKETPIQSEHDDSAFYVVLFGNEVYAMGEEFDPNSFDMTLDEMLSYIDEGIKKFLTFSTDEISVEDLGDYADFFTTEIYDEGYESLPVAYVIAKLICGKENAKWNDRNY